MGNAILENEIKPVGTVKRRYECNAREKEMLCQVGVAQK